MAENERLDVLKNRRWLRLMRFIASNPQEAEITRRLTEAMYRTLRSVGKQIPLEALLKAAAESDPSLSRSVADCRHDFAEMIERVAVEPAIDSTSTICERYVDAVLDRYLDQIGLKLVGGPPFTTFDSYCDQVSRWKALIRPTLRQLSRVRPNAAGASTTSSHSRRRTGRASGFIAPDRSRTEESSCFAKRSSRSASLTTQITGGAIS